MVQEIAQPDQQEQEPIPSAVPVLAVSESIVFPKMVIPLSVEGGADRDAIEAAVERDRMLLVITEKPDAQASVPDSLYEIGTVSHIHRMTQLPADGLQVIIRGRARAKATEHIPTDEALLARIETVEEEEGSEDETEPRRQSLLRLFEEIVELSPYLPEDAYVQALNVDTAGILADPVAAALPVEIPKKQQVLMTTNVVERLEMVQEMAQEARDSLQVAQEVGSEAKEEIDDELKEDMDFVYVDSIDDAVEAMLQ